MKFTRRQLDNMIDKKVWYKMQKQMAIVSNITTQVIDFCGDPITDYSFTNPFCEYALKDENMSVYCKKCKRRGALEAVQRHKPYIHLCPFDLIEISVPIVIGDECLGSISGGQVALLVPEAGEHLEHLVEKRNLDEILKDDKVRKMYEETPKMKCIDIMDATRMYDGLKDFLVQSFLANVEDELLKKHNAKVEEDSCEEEESFPSKQGKMDKHFWENTVPPEYMPRNHLLRPAVEYIFENKGENLSLSEAAKLSHISVSYFSRLFTKEMGVSYSLFINQVKISWSKELLLETDMTVTQISTELGYTDSAYFVKMFKRYEGMTPSRYRKNQLNE